MKKIILLSMVLIYLIFNVKLLYAKKAESSIEDFSKITEKIAVQNAKKYVIENGLQDKYHLDKTVTAKIKLGYKYENGHLGWSRPESSYKYKEVYYWEVLFSPKVSFLKGGFLLFVNVNAETGEVETTGNYKR